MVIRYACCDWDFTGNLTGLGYLSCRGFASLFCDLCFVLHLFDFPDVEVDAIEMAAEMRGVASGVDIDLSDTAMWDDIGAKLGNKPKALTQEEPYPLDIPGVTGVKKKGNLSTIGVGPDKISVKFMEDR